MTNLFYPSLSVYLQRRAEPGPSRLPHIDSIFSHPPALPRVADRMLWEGDARWNARPATGQGDELYMMRVAWNGKEEDIRRHLSRIEGCVEVNAGCLMLEHGESPYRGVTVPIWKSPSSLPPSMATLADQVDAEVITEPRARRSWVGQYRLNVSRTRRG